MPARLDHRTLAETLKRLLRDERGNAGVVGALLVVTLATAVGGATDLTGISSTGAKLQDAADSGALAATLTLMKDPNATAATLKARALEMAAPAHTASGNKNPPTATVTIESVAPARVKVVLSQDRTLNFGGLFGMHKAQVSRAATAVAGKGLELCMLVLAKDADSAVSVGGTADLKALKCGIQVNSSSPKALGGNGNATVTSAKAYVVGPAQPANNWKPKPLFGQAPMPDPFAGKMPWPSPGLCTPALGDLKKVTKTLVAVNPATPFVICGGIDVGNGGTLKLMPGTYVVQSGDVEVKSGGKIDGGAGVTLVLTDPQGEINVQAGGDLVLQSQKTGPWAGVALAVKPQPGERTSTLTGGGEFELDGIVYMPTQKLELTGGASIEKKESPRAFVANRIELSGNGQMFIRGAPGKMVKPAEVRLVN